MAFSARATARYWPCPAGFGALTVLLLAGSTMAATPTVEQALKLAPVQSGVEYDRPAEADAAKCTIKAEKFDGQTGWVVRAAAGQVLRRFVDTNGDNTVDLWSYYRDGLEVYRDIDSNFNGKADQARWLNTAGSRWGIDRDEDGKLDEWKTISAEEVSAEAVAALAERDAARFARLLLTPSELGELGIGGDRGKALREKIEAAPAAFKTLAGRQKAVTAKTKWVHFGGSQPGTVPAGADGATKDLLVYENVLAMVETDGQHDQVQIGTLVKAGDAWRLVDAPQAAEPGQAELADGGFFFQAALRNRPEALGGGLGGNEKLQELLAGLERLDQAAATASPDQQASAITERTKLLEQIAAAAGSADERGQWLRQLADSVSAAVQSGTYPDGVAKLKELSQKLADDGDEDLVAYYTFRTMTAEYFLSLQEPNPDFAKIQTQWLDSLKKYVDDYPKSPDTAEAVLQLGVAEEFAGQEDEAKKWYTRVVSQFPEAPAAQKAAGARARLDSIGKAVQIRGASPAGKSVDLSQFRGKAVLVQYWATWCEPCKADMAQIKDALAKYGKSGFTVIGISLDSRKEDLAAFLKRNQLPWPQIYEPGGLDSRLANELGILTLPTMLLIDQKGKVVNRNIHASELDRELKALLR